MTKYCLRIYLVSVALAFGTVGTRGYAQATRTGEELQAAQPSAAASATKSASQVMPPSHKGSAKWWGADATPGWALMSWKERNEHRKKMRTIKPYPDCKSYLDQHHERMTERAKARGMPLHEPKHDPCAALKP